MLKLTCLFVYSLTLMLLSEGDCGILLRHL